METGIVRRVIGPVVDVQFPSGRLPDIYNAIEVEVEGRKVVMEPMTPSERRLVHSHLQSFNGVETHSEGDEPYRRVIVTAVK